MGVKVGLIAEYSKIFPERNETVEELCYGIPKTLIFQAGTTFLANQTLDNKSSFLLEVTEDWFRTENHPFKEEIFNRIIKYYSEKVRKLSDSEKLKWDAYLFFKQKIVQRFKREYLIIKQYLPLPIC